MDVLVTRQMPGEALKRLAETCRVDVWREPYPLPREELIRRIRDKDALLCLLTDAIDAEVMDASGRLRIIANYAVGFDNIDRKAASERGITVTNTPGVLTDATADLAWALLFAAARRIVEADALVRRGDWRGWDPNLMLGCDIFGQTLGVIGTGRIGTAFALRAQGFDMQVLYTDEQPNRVLETRLGARRAPLGEVLANSDFISLHVPLTERTRHLIGPCELACMRPEAILINTSRGAVLDEQALALALDQGRIAAAGLDVFEREPQVHPELLKLPNVVLLPHIASATVHTRTGMADLAVENLLAFQRGDEPPHALRPDQPHP